MGATLAIVGHPISVAGVWTAPSQIGNAVAASAGWTYLIPVASLSGGQLEASVLLGQAGATVIG